MSIQASTNSNSRLGVSELVERTRIAIPAGTQNKSATAIHRLPCKCCRNVSQYNARHALTREVRIGVWVVRPPVGLASFAVIAVDIAKD